MMRALLSLSRYEKGHALFPTRSAATRWRKLAMNAVATLAGVAACVAVAPQDARAQWTWKSTATGDWSTTTNWDLGTAPSFSSNSNNNALNFGNNTVGALVQLRNLTTGDKVQSITFSTGASAYTFKNDQNDGNSIVFRNATGGGTLENDSANVQTIRQTTDNRDGNHDIMNAYSGITVMYAKTAGFDVQGGIYLGSSSGAGIAYKGAGNSSITYLDSAQATAAVAASVTVSTTTTPTTEGAAGVLTLKQASVGRTTGVDWEGKVRIGTTDAPTTGSNTASLRIQDAKALGTVGTSSASNTEIFGGQSNGRLELDGSLNVAEYIILHGRTLDPSNTFNNATSVALKSVSGSSIVSGLHFNTNGGNQYNFGADTGSSLTVQAGAGANGLIFGAPDTVARYITFRGAGNGAVTGTIFGANNSATGQIPIVQYGSGTFTLNTIDTYRLGHLIAAGGGTLALGANLGNAQTPTDVAAGYGLFAATDPNGIETRFQLLNNSTLDVNAATSLQISPGVFGLNRVIAGNGTVIGNIETVSANAFGVNSPYNNANGGQAAFKPGNGMTFDTDGVSVTGTTGGVGHLTIQGNLDMVSGGSVDDYQWHLGGAFDQSSGTAGVNWDLITVAGDSKFDNNDTLTLSFSQASIGDPNGGDPFWLTSHTWKIIDTDTNSGGVAGFGTINNWVFAAGSFSVSLGSGGSAGDLFLNFTAAPEPTSLLLAMFSFVGLAVIRRRIRK